MIVINVAGTPIVCSNESHAIRVVKSAIAHGKSFSRMEIGTGHTIPKTQKLFGIVIGSQFMERTGVMKYGSEIYWTIRIWTIDKDCLVNPIESISPQRSITKGKTKRLYVVFNGKFVPCKLAKLHLFKRQD